MIWPFTKKQPAHWEETIIVTFDEDQIITSYPDGQIEMVFWNKLDSVEVHTNDTGPWGADVWFVLSSDNEVCSFPLGSKGCVELIERLQLLSGFEFKGMNSTGNAKFLCWTKSAH